MEGEILAHKLETLHEDVRQIESVLRELTSAITKLAVIEERQNTTAAALERAFKALAKVEDRVSELESYVPANRRLSVWVDRATWAALGLLGMFIIKTLGVS